MKIIVLSFSIVLTVLTIQAQTVIPEHADYYKLLGVTQNSQSKPTKIFYSDGNTIDGQLVYESNSIDPQFYAVDMQRFGYIDKGKLRTKRLKFDDMDSLMIDTVMYRFKEIKLSASAISVTKKHALYRIIKDFGKTALLMYVPTGVPFGTNIADVSSIKIVENKVSNKFFQYDAGLQNFTKALGKFLGDCPSIGEELIANKEKSLKNHFWRK
ncbi:MAG: hypothetical protein IPP49_08655 [Saprospiraceae bacterium]|nr:hypothetical protein [Saprospiraceae bacterium]